MNTYNIDAKDLHERGIDAVLADREEFYKERMGPIIKYFPESIQEKEEEIERDRNNFHFVIHKKDINTEVLASLKKIAEQLLKEGRKVDIVVYQQMKKTSNKEEKANYVYSAEEMEKLVELNNGLIGLGMEHQIGFDEFVGYDDVSRVSIQESWSLNSVIKANQEIDKVVNTIKEKNLSPFEAMLYIHGYVTGHFKYTKTKVVSELEKKYKPGSPELKDALDRLELREEEKSRVIVSSYQDGEIVCSGYASLVKAIIDKLNDKNLKCEFISCELKKFKSNDQNSANEESMIEIEAHCQNLIYINDTKYKIDGCYMEDATWDSKRGEDFSSGVGYANCLYPVKDVLHLDNKVYLQKFFEDRYSTLIASSKNEVLSEKKEKILKFIDESKISKTLKRRINILTHSMPELIQIYKGRSKPIPINTYLAGLKNLYIKNALTQDRAERFAIKEILNSIIVANAIFTNHAQSSFVQCSISKREKIEKRYDELDIAKKYSDHTV